MTSRKTGVQYEHIRISGTPFERGKQYGKKATAKIRKNIAHYLEPGELPPWNRVLHYIHKMYLPALKQYFPAGLEEMKGIAEGAGVTLEEIIMVNARYDLARAPGGSRHHPSPKSTVSKPQTSTTLRPAVWPAVRGDTGDYEAIDYANECTSAAFLAPSTAAGNVIVTQNWDISGYLYHDDIALLLEVHPDPSEGVPSMFLLTEAGQLGRSGMNSAGLGLCANALNSTADYFPDDEDMKPVLPIAVLRRMFLHQKTYPQALQLVYNAPRHVSGNLTLGTAEGFALCMELTPNSAFIVTPEKNDHIIHSNHYLSPGMAARPDIHDAYLGGSSWYRHIRFEKGVAPYLSGKVDESVITKAFSDHLGYPQSLCEHIDRSPGDGLPGYPFKKSMTVACVIYDLTRRAITTCKGNPCTGIFETYKLDD